MVIVIVIVIPQHLAATNVVIDGETLRARVRAAEIQGRLEDMVKESFESSSPSS